MAISPEDALEWRKQKLSEECGEFENNIDELIKGTYQAGAIIKVKIAGKNSIILDEVKKRFCGAGWYVAVTNDGDYWSLTKNSSSDYYNK